MKSMSKGKKILSVLIVVVLVLLGVSVITDTPPVVFISGKPHFVFTKKLYLNENRPDSYTNDDVKALSHMRFVESFEMWGTKITDISFLNGMSRLKSLTIVTNYQIDDFTPLGHCTKLERFKGYIPDISDLSAFKELSELYFLQVNINGSKINDISDVKYLINLEWFLVGGENITDISELKYCTKLRHLSLVGTVSDVDYSVLHELPKLSHLFIDKGVLTENDVKTLEERGVSVNFNEVEDKTE